MAPSTPNSSGSVLARSPKVPDRLLSIKDLAVFSGLSLSFLYKAVETKTIPHFRIGASIRFAPYDVADWIESARVMVRTATPSIPPADDNGNMTSCPHVVRPLTSQPHQATSTSEVSTKW